MYRKILLVIMIGLFVLTACAGALAAGNPRPNPDEGTSNGQTPEQPAPDSWQPAPGDEKLGRAEVEIETSEILTLESFPPQFMLHVTGWKGNPCNLLRVKVSEPDEQQRIQVEVYTLYDPAALCIQVLEGFDIQVPLGSFETGEYSVWMNGQQVGTIVAP